MSASSELGNNGVHVLDRLRWLLGLDAPTRVAAGGGKLFYDDQQTPDTMAVTFDFPGCCVTYEWPLRSAPRTPVTRQSRCKWRPALALRHVSRG